MTAQSTIYALQRGRSPPMVSLPHVGIELADEQLLDALVFSSPGRPWRDVMVAGRWDVNNRRHEGENSQAFKAAMSELASSW